MHQQNPVDAPPESRGTTRIRRTPTESCLHLQRVCSCYNVSSSKFGNKEVPERSVILTYGIHQIHSNNTGQAGYILA